MQGPHKIPEQRLSAFLSENPYFRRRSGSQLIVPPEAAIHEKGGAAADSSDDSGAEDHDEILPTRDHTESDAQSIEDLTIDDFAAGRLVIANVVPDTFSEAKHLDANGKLKLRRPEPQIFMSDLLSGLVERDGQQIFIGPLNGWPALVHLELESLSIRARGKLGLRSKVKNVWRPGLPLPVAAETTVRMRATFRTPTWATIGWSPASPGFVWWFTGQRDGPCAPGPKQFAHGEQTVAFLEEDDHELAFAHATYIHAFAHRYPVEHETMRDKHTWHTGCFVEWSHGRFITLMELAWRDGCGGYGGKSNWCEDKLEDNPHLEAVMPSGLKGPWDVTRSEIRLIDMPLKSKEDFEAFLKEYSAEGGQPFELQRFVEPRVYASAKVRIRRCRPADLAGYLLSYVSRAGVYDQLTANCQVFTADVLAFLGGLRNVQPFSAMIQPRYSQHFRSFLYEPGYLS